VIVGWVVTVPLAGVAWPSILAAAAGDVSNMCIPPENMPAPAMLNPHKTAAIFAFVSVMKNAP
jgi:hypothetical protein